MNKKNSYASLNIRIKKILDDIIDTAFENDDNNKKYHAFMLYVINKENSSYSGLYHEKGHVIEVFNPSLGANHLAKCALHELSHHIDLVQNGCTGHQKPFYDCYRRLIYASLDMGILKEEDFNDTWSSDRNKVKKIVSEYKKKEVTYQKKTKKIIKVKNAFTIKDILKQNGYRWNGIEQVWEKDTEKIEEEKEFLNSLDVSDGEESNKKKPYYIVSLMGNMKIDAVIYIEAVGDAYERREALKKYGFYFYGEKKQWIKKTTPDDYERLKKLAKTDASLEGVHFVLIK